MTSPREWAASLTADQVEVMFHAALGAGDAKGVEAALILLTMKDPHRAETLYELTKAALHVAQAADREDPPMTSVTTVDLDAIRARADAATPGPWHADPDQVTVNTGDGRALIKLADVLLGDDDTRDNHPQASADAAFIAAAREDVPALLAEIERLRAAVVALADYADERAHAHIDGAGLAQAGFAGIAATARKAAAQ